MYNVLCTILFMDLELYKCKCLNNTAVDYVRFGKIILIQFWFALFCIYVVVVEKYEVFDSVFSSVSMEMLVSKCFFLLCQSPCVSLDRYFSSCIVIAIALIFDAVLN